MAGQWDSAVLRTPREIWWKILDETIDADVPLMFATTYEANNWSEDSPWYMVMGKDHLYQNSERQMKIVGSVCRSWQAFARSRTNRRLDISPHTWLFNREAIPNARHVTLRRDIIHLLPPALKNGVNWEILRVDQPSAMKFASLVPHLRLRRLQLWTPKSKVFDSNQFLAVLGNFTGITWLDYEANFPDQVSTISVDQDRPHVTLPNLQVLFYKVRKLSVFPISHLILPSLRHLSIHFSIPIDNVPLVDILSPFRQTVQSIAVRSIIPRHQRRLVHFPHWKEFPKLEELVLDRQWAVYFERFPSNHPLRKIDAQHGSFYVLPSILDGPHVRQVVLQRTRWTSTGGLIGDDEDSALDLLQTDQILDRAKDCGIKFEVTWDGMEILSRQKASTPDAAAGEVTPDQQPSLSSDMDI
jgi:hypothetical protein